MFKNKISSHILLVITVLLYFVICFYLQRHQTLTLLTCYFGLFLIYIFIIKLQDPPLTYWVYASIIIRCMLLFSTPNLSDDFYRFIWDGRLLAAGYHPFAEVPSFYMQDGITVPGLNKKLFDALNSKEYFTIYPPVLQLIFWVSATMSPGSTYGSIIVMKLFIVVAEIITILTLQQLLKKFNVKVNNVLVYALNPLVIIELTANLHFEAVMICFIVLAVRFLILPYLKVSSLCFSLAIASKLIPVVLFPALVSYVRTKSFIKFCVFVFLFTLLISIPLLHKDLISGFNSSLSYYFKKFEFNASIYYLIRSLGYKLYGYNIIQTMGWKLAVTAMLLIVVYLAWRNLSLKKQHKPKEVGPLLFTDFMLELSIYFLFTTTLHPWYVTTLVALCLFTPYRFPVVWSLMIFLTYAGYSPTSFTENMWIIGIEYTTVIGFFLFELYGERKKVREATVNIL